MFSQDTLNTGIIQNLQIKIQAVLDELNKANLALNDILKQEETLLYYQKRIQTLEPQIQNAEDITNPAFVKAFDEYFQLHSRTKMTAGGIADRQKNLIDKQKFEMEYKNALLKGYQIIMEVRSIFKEPIQYGITYMGENSQGQKVMMMKTMSIEELVKAGTAVTSASGNLSIQLIQTGAQIQELINESIQSNSMASQFQNMLSNREDQEIWQRLFQIREKISKIKADSKKIYYNFGQLVEAFHYLKGKTLSTNNIYEALQQGLNTTPYQTSGDFLFEGQDIQSKAFQNYFGDSNTKHKVSILRTSQVRGVLISILSAISYSDINTMKYKLEKVFEVQGGYSQNWNSETIQAAIKDEIQSVLEKFEIQKWNNL